MEVERHVQNASLEPEAVWKLLAWLEETQPTLNIRDDDPYPSFMLRKLLESLEGVEDLEALRVEIIRTAKEALAAQHDHLQQSVQDHMDRAIERLDDQVSQRVEMAEIAMEGVELEAEEHNRELDSQALIRAVEQSAGLKIRLDQSSQDRANLDIMEFRRQVPDLIEASMALRVWAGLVNTVQRRIGQELPLESSLQIPLDWDSAMEALHTAMDQAWAQRVEKLETDIGRDLDAALRKESEVTEALKLRLLIQVSYGQEMFFDRKTHQKRTATVARFSYAYSAARLLDLADPEALIREIIDHLEGAQEALAMSLGRAELHRLGRSHPEALDERLVSTLRSELKEEFDQIAESDTLASLPSPMKEKIAQILGERRLTEAYRVLILSVGDRIWVDYLTQIEALRTSIGLEAYGQRDPLVQYKSRAYDMFQSLLADIRAGVVHQLFRAQAPRKTSSSAPQPSRSSPGTSPTSGASKPRKRKRRRRRH
jgi:preprotein translocase subunit SecA